MASSNNHSYAGGWRRFLAAITDGIILTLLGLGITQVLGTNPYSTTPQNYLEVIDMLLTYGVGALYTILFWIVQDGQTLGKRLMNIRIVKQDGGKLDIGTAIIRYIGYFISAIVLCIGFIWILFDNKHQGWHDKIAKTDVVIVGPGPNKILAVILVLAFLILNSLPSVSSYLDKSSIKEKAPVKNESNVIDGYNMKPETQELVDSANAKIDELVRLSQGKSLNFIKNPNQEVLMNEAISEAKKATELEPENAETWAALGGIYTKLNFGNNNFYAIEAYKKAISLFPEDYTYHVKIATAYYFSEQYSLSIEHLEKAVELQPNTSIGFYNLGIAYAKIGDKVKAREALEKARVLPMDNPGDEAIDKHLNAL